MKRKTCLVAIAFSLATGWMMAGDATPIKISSPRIVINDKMPLPLVIIDRNGKKFEITGDYDPATGTINIDTSWAGPNSSISIPVLGTGYMWMNGNWIDEEGFYWDGQRKVKLSDPQWKERWNSYWRDHPIDKAGAGMGMQGKMDTMRERGEQRRDFGERVGEYGENMREQGDRMVEKADDWKERMQDWRDNRGDAMRGKPMPSSDHDAGQPGMMSPSGSQEYQYHQTQHTQQHYQPQQQQQQQYQYQQPQQHMQHTQQQQQQNYMNPEKY